MSLPPPRFARPFETIGHSNTLGGMNNPLNASQQSSSSPAGLTRTPPASARPGNQPAENNGNTNTNDSAAAAAANKSLALEQQQQQKMYVQSMQNVKEAAQRDKTLLMHRVEELSKTIHELQRRSSVQTEELESYHRAFGSLDDFTSRQVRVREELVVLRDAVRQWQDRETEARGEVSRLNKVLDAVRRGQRHTSGESRLKDIEERLAMAHLQRNELSKEIDDIVEMERTKRERHAVLLQRTAGIAAGGGGDPQMLAAELAAAAPGVDGSYLNWQMRGKLADLQRLLRQKDDAIESLQKAADSLHQISRSDRFETIGAVNRQCPGCNELPWKSPFCPETGAKHLAFDPHLDRAKELEREKALRAPIFQPLSEEQITSTVREWLHPETGTWTMLREVTGGGQHSTNISGTHSRRDSTSDDGAGAGGGLSLYREKNSGRIVEDLRAVVEQQHLREHEDRVNEYETLLREERLRREAEEIEAAKDPVPHLSVQPSLKTEILSLTAALEAKKDENMRLRTLLEAVCSSGSVGVSSTGVASAGMANMANLVQGGEDQRMQAGEGMPPPPQGEGEEGSNEGGGGASPGPPPGSPGSPHQDENAPKNSNVPSSRGQLFRGARTIIASNRMFPNAEDRTRSAHSPGGHEDNEAIRELHSVDSAPVTLHDEDDVQTFTKIQRISRENHALGKRCSELVLALVERDDQITQLRDALGRSNAMDSDRYVSQLRRESAQLRDRLLQEERRAANLEEEVRRLKRFEPKSFQRT